MLVEECVDGCDYGSQHFLAITIITDSQVVQFPIYGFFVAKGEVVNIVLIDKGELNSLWNKSLRAFAHETINV